MVEVGEVCGVVEEEEATFGGFRICATEDDEGKSGVVHLHAADGFGGDAKRESEEIAKGCTVANDKGDAALTIAQGFRPDQSKRLLDPLADVLKGFGVFWLGMCAKSVADFGGGEALPGSITTLPQNGHLDQRRGIGKPGERNPSGFAGAGQVRGEGKLRRTGQERWLALPGKRKPVSKGAGLLPPSIRERDILCPLKPAFRVVVSLAVTCQQQGQFTGHTVRE